MILPFQNLIFSGKTGKKDKTIREESFWTEETQQKDKTIWQDSQDLWPTSSSWPPWPTVSKDDPDESDTEG